MFCVRVILKMDSGRSLSPRSRTGSRTSPRLSPISPPSRRSRKSRGSPYRSLSINTSGAGSAPSRSRSDSEILTPFPSEKYTHTTYTTYVKGTTYTCYTIQEAPKLGFQLDAPKGVVMQTTYKTLRRNKKWEDTWFTQIHNWITEQPKDGSPALPSSPRRKLRSIKALDVGKMSPQTFSGIG